MSPRRGLLSLLLLIASVAGAQTPDEVVAAFAKQDRNTRKEQTAKFCRTELKSWPQPSYEAHMRRLGQLWNTQPEAAYAFLDICQTIWMSEYFSPFRLQVVDNKVNPESWIAPALNLIRSAGYLREEIYAFSRLKGTNGGQVPPAPYEILTGMSSSQRNLDEILHREMRSAVSILTSVGGALASALVDTKGFTTMVTATSASVGRAAKYALVVGIAAILAGEAVDLGLWELRYSDLSQHVSELQNKIMADKIANPVLIDEYYNAIKQLGYFLSFDVYLKESQVVSETPSRPQECTKELAKFFQARESQPRIHVSKFTNSQICPDAAVLWLEAAAFLSGRFPKDSAAQSVASRLHEKALLTYMSYEAAWAYIATLPVCRMSPQSTVIFGTQYECFDPKTGDPVL